jgi:hypothetical protein
VKLAAEFSLPGAPVNFGHFGYSHSGRVRFAFGLPSNATSPAGAFPFSTTRAARRGCPRQLAQTLKPGVSRAFGGNRGWTVSAYYAAGINEYARLSQYRYDAGFDVTWYPWKYR